MIRPLFRSRIVSSLLRILLVLLLIAGLGFGLLQGYYWYQVRSVVEDAKKQISLVAKLEYGSIETGFDGVVGVRDLVVTPLGQDRGVTIDAVRLKTSGLMELLNLKIDIDKGQPPQQLGFEIEGLTIDLAGPMLKQLAAQAAAGQPQPVDWMPGCEAALAGVSDLALMQKLGYQKLSMTLSANYRFDSVTKLLQLQMTQSLDKLFTSTLSAAVDLGINEFNRQNLILAKPALGAVKLHYQDRSYNKRLVNFCAKATGESDQDFIDRHIALELEGMAALGLVIPESLANAYRQFLSGRGDVRLSLLQGRTLSVAELPLYSPEQLLELLAPTLTVDGKSVEPLTIGWQPVDDAADPIQEQVRSSVEAIATLLQAPFVEPEPEVEADPVEAALKSEPVNHSPQRGFRVTGLDQLESHIGTHIRIDTNNGFRVEGRLLSVERKELRIYQEKGTGDATLPIAFKHIDTVRVYR